LALLLLWCCQSANLVNCYTPEKSTGVWRVNHLSGKFHNILLRLFPGLGYVSEAWVLVKNCGMCSKPQQNAGQIESAGIHGHSRKATGIINGEQKINARG